MWDGAARVVTLGKPNSTGRLEGRIPEVGQDEGAAREGGVALPGVLRWFWALSVAAFVLMIAISWLEARAGMKLDERGPLPDPLFGDLLEYLPTFKLLHSPGFFTQAGQHAVAYPPFGAALFGLLYSFGRPVVFYLSIVGAAFGAAMWGVRQALVRRGIGPWVATLFPLTVLVVSFPFEGLVQRGNIELFVWMFVAVGVWAVTHGREDLAGAMWGAAAAVTLYPVLLLVLFVRRAKLRALLAGCVSFAVLTVAAVRYLSPEMGAALEGSTRSVAGYQGVRTALWSLHELAVNHSAFEWFKLVAGGFLGAASLSRAYVVCGGVLFLVAYFGRARRMPLVNQLLVVLLFMVLLPPVSYFYTLTNLYAPWVLLVLLVIEAQRRRVTVPGLRGVILMFVPVFAAFSVFTFRRALLFGGLIQSFVMMWILIAALQYRFELPGGRMEEKGARA